MRSVRVLTLNLACVLSVAQVQDAVMASKRRDAPHLVAPIRRYATSKVSSVSAAADTDYTNQAADCSRQCCFPMEALCRQPQQGGIMSRARTLAAMELTKPWVVVL